MKFFHFLLLMVLSSYGYTQTQYQAKTGKKNQVNIARVVVIDKPSFNWITYPTDSLVVGQNIQKFNCLVNSRLPLQKIEVKVNGLTLDVYSSGDFSQAVSENNYEQTIERTITLRTGFNNISILAQNVKGVINESSRKIIVDPNQITVLRNEKDKTPPMIYVSNPANIRDDVSQVFESVVKITGTVIDESGIQQLTINNITTPLKENGAFTINLPLNVGETAITIEAKDINQNIALRKFTIERKNTDGSEYKVENARNFLIVIGVNKYQSWPQLFNAVSDVKGVNSILTSNYLFEPENVTLLVDEDATRANIYNALRTHIEKITPQDNLLVYYSGHGYFDKLLNEGYWVPVDGQKNDPSSYIPNTQILKIIENINSQHTFLVADACFSGSLFASASRGYAEQVERYKSRWGLASGRLEEVSDGSIGATNSPFTQSFIEFLKTNPEQKAAVSDLVQYVKKSVAAANQQTPVGNPLKGVGDEGGEFVFYKRQ
jgi:hypothetical protein